MGACAPGCQISLSAGARKRLVDARAIVDRYAEGDEPIYGLNTGLGGNVGFRLSKADISAFQVQMIRGRCIGVGEPFSETTSRMILLCRLIGLSQGGSGLSPSVFNLMLAMFNAGLSPVIPGRGSIGAGDLGLCAHLGATVIGEGHIFVDAKQYPAGEALASVGLQPASLGPKDGLSILNSNAVTCGHACQVLASLGDILTLSVVTACLADEGFAANPSIFDERLARSRPARGQQRAASLFRRILMGSFLYDKGAARSIQDALSFRVLSQIYGPALTSFETAVESVETEINAASDNPLVLIEDGLILSTANFHTPAIALAFDTLAIVNTHLATASAYRTIKMMNAQLSGLPKYLSPIGGVSNGFNSLQKTVAYLHGEVRLKAMPGSLDCLPVSESVEDHAPQTALTIRKLEEQMVALRLMIAIEALVAAQAVDIGQRPRLAPMTQLLYDAIRAKVPQLIEDRATGPDVDLINRLFESGDFRRVIADAVSKSPLPADDEDWPFRLR
jgi:histidine ammonia-lyase